ncbi:MAG TPA: hypothetical protein VED87_11935, partial [Methylocystis sp.]|nr:hypothetical protein [Methylocystis sp.]
MTAPEPAEAPAEEDLLEEEDALEEASGADLSETQTPESVRRGVAVVKRLWKLAPDGPGVYRMIAE